MKKCFLIAVLLFNFSFPQTIQTPLEKSEYKTPTNYVELTDYLIKISKNYPDIKLDTIAKSVEGRNLYAVYFSKGKFGKDRSKLRVLIFCQQHGDEQSGKEGALLLINELLKPENKYLFNKIDFALVPQMNPDGSEKNERRNGNGMDLNRNHLILTEPETIGLHKLFNKYLFEVTMDVHEYFPYGETWQKYGYWENNDEEIGTLTNINVSADIRELSNHTYLPYINKYLNDRGFSYFEYSPGGPPEIAYIRHSTFDINDGRQGFGILNSVSFIQEGLNGKDDFADNIKHRADGQMTGMRGLLEFSYLHKDQIKKLVGSEREKLINNKIDAMVAIQLDHFADGSKLNMPLLSYYTNKDTVVTVKDYHPVVKSLHDVKRPKGYLVPANLKEIIDWADKHSVKYVKYKKDKIDKFEQYYINKIDSMNFEGDIIAKPVVNINKIPDFPSGNDYVYIPVKQLKNNTIVIALEPESELGLVTYKQFAHLLKVNENYPILRVVER